MFDIYLASQSPRRRELLRQIGVQHQVLNVDVSEQYRDGESPEQYVRRLALEKSAAGWAQCQLSGLNVRPVLGADTLGELDGQVLEKPLHRDHALDMLMSMSGREHRVLSAVAITSGQGQQSRVSETLVRFRQISRLEAQSYWNTGEPADKAGGYAIQGFAALFVERIVGSYSGVVGLPLMETGELLQQHGVPCWNQNSTGAVPA